jgi:hypothetical protein
MGKWNLLCRLIRLTTPRRKWTDRFLALRKVVNNELDSHSDRWMTYGVRLKRPLPPVAIAKSSEQIGIVIQGKLKTEEDFTLETVRLYRQTFLNCPIFVSTWNDESPAAVQALEAAGATVLLNEPPALSGWSHLNYQIRSTLAGIHAATEAGCQYVLKTRTDTRMYAGNIAPFLVGLLTQFPVRGTRNATGRLAVLDWATRLFLPQHPADILMFGHIEDMTAYWSAELCEERDIPDSTHRQHFAELLNPLVPEIYLCRRYLKKLGYDYQPTVASWWNVLGDLFVVVDRTQLGHFWWKYDYQAEHQNTLDDDRRNEAVCTFRDWLGVMLARSAPTFEVEDLLGQTVNGLLPAA